MWICPQCGEPHEIHFRLCWKCASVETHVQAGPPPPSAPPVERKVRSLGWVMARALIAFVIGVILGMAVFHRHAATLVEAAISGAVVGLILAGVVGVVLWVVFPYEPATSPVDNPVPSRQDDDISQND